MIRKIAIPTLLALVVCAAAILATTSSTPKELDDFYANPEIAVIYANIQPRPGGPRENCPNIPIPVLSVWGDGLAFINNSMYDRNATNYVGVLTSDQIKDQLSFLDRHGFLKSFDLEPVNPAGTWIEMGANLKTVSVKYEGGANFKPQLLMQLIDRLTPFLQPVQVNTPLDERILKALSPYPESCN